MKDTEQLKQYLRVEPGASLPPIFLELCRELQTSYRDSAILERKIEQVLALPEDDDPNPDVGEVWPGFQIFMKEYLEYWRDANFDDLLGAHALLFGLTKYVLL